MTATAVRPGRRISPERAADLAHLYAQKMVNALHLYEQQKEQYGAVRESYFTAGRTPEVAELRAASDPRLTRAAGLGPWYREEAVAYAAAAAAMAAIANGPRS